MKEIFPGIFQRSKEIFTLNAVPGTKVYGEALAKHGGKEYRLWDPNRSKLGAAIANGLKAMPIESGSKVLYLGAASGTTVSHVSDIVGNKGAIYAVEFSERPFRDLAALSKKRQNIFPILTDARKPESYGWIEQADVIFVDIAQPDETEIAIRNAGLFLRIGGHIMIAVKSQSIDVTKEPKQVYRQEAEKLRRAAYSVIETVELDPYETAHALIVARK